MAARILVASFFEAKGARQAHTALSGKLPGVKISYVTSEALQLMSIHESPDSGGSENSDNPLSDPQLAPLGEPKSDVEDSKQAKPTTTTTTTPTPTLTPTPEPLKSGGQSPRLESQKNDGSLHEGSGYRAAKTLPQPLKSTQEHNKWVLAATMKGERIFREQSSPSESSFEWDGLNERYDCPHDSAASTCPRLEE